MSQYQTIFSYGLWEIRQAPSGRLELWYKKEFVRGESRRLRGVDAVKDFKNQIFGEDPISFYTAG